MSDPRSEDATKPESADAEPPSARDLQENDGPLEVEPGSDADQAAEVPHVG